MAQIRETIEALCGILRSNGTCRIQPELFRLAKFNDDTCVKIWWKLLFDLVYLCKKGRIDEVVEVAVNQMSPDELTEYVKRELAELGMSSPEFSALPADMTQGSRELLIAFGWLVCHESVVERFMMVRSLENLPSFYSDNELDGNKVKPKSPVTLPDCRPQTDPVVQVKQLLLVNGRLDHHLRGLHALQRQRTKLSHKIAKTTYGVSVDGDKDHLSLLDVQMLRHPRVLNEMMGLIEKENDRLQKLQAWRKHEESFWNWMLTVLELKNEEKQKESEAKGVMPVEADGVPRVGVSRAVMTTMEDTQKDLHETIIKYESIIEQLEHVWHNKSASITEVELDSLLVSINMEVSLYKVRLSRDTRSILHPHSPQPRPLSCPQFWFYKASASQETVDVKLQLGDKARAKLCEKVGVKKDSKNIKNSDRGRRSGCDVEGVVVDETEAGVIAGESVRFRHSATGKLSRSDEREEDARFVGDDERGHAELSSRDIHKRFNTRGNPSFSRRGGKLSPKVAGSDKQCVDIVTEIARVRALVDDLEGRLAAKQETFRNELHEMTGSVPHAVCIPPMARK